MHDLCLKKTTSIGLHLKKRPEYGSLEAHPGGLFVDENKKCTVMTVTFHIADPDRCLSVKNGLDCEVNASVGP